MTNGAVHGKKHKKKKKRDREDHKKQNVDNCMPKSTKQSSQFYKRQQQQKKTRREEKKQAYAGNLFIIRQSFLPANVGRQRRPLPDQRLPRPRPGQLAGQIGVCRG